MLIIFSFLMLHACTDAPELLSINPEPIGITTDTIVQIESELNAAYALWEEEEYDQAFVSLERLNHDSMHTVWPILRSEDAESTLHLEVQFGKVLWATERKRSIVKNEAARSLKSLLLRELNDVRLIEPVSNEAGDSIQSTSSGSLDQ